MAVFKPTVIGIAVAVLIGELRRRDLDADALLDEFGWQYERMTTPLARLPQGEVMRFIEKAIALSGDPALHIFAATNAPLGAYHVADYFTMFASSIGQGYRLTMSNSQIFNNAVAFKIEEHAHEAVVTLTAKDGGPPHVIESEFLLPTFSGRTYLLSAGEAELPTVVFGHRPDADLGVIEQLGRCNVVVAEGSANQMIVPMSTWQHKSVYANPTMHEILDRLAVRTSARKETARAFLSRIESALTITLEDGGKIGAVAQLLHMSARTLQRRLEALGVQFREVVTRTRHRLAMDLLNNADLPLIEIALRLGYSDASAFSRAFKGATGHAPSSFRRLTGDVQNDVKESLAHTSGAIEPANEA